jgi:shikimate dehydrogenase
MITYGLIGYPLTHSGSHNYFTDKFRKEQIGGVQYKLFPLKELTSLTTLIQDHPNLSGLNVTIPYKEKILPFLNWLDPVAKKIGAVNTIKIVRHEGSLILNGYNTDAGGFLYSVNLSGYKHALVLGTGGASKAVAFVLKNSSIKFLFVSRSKVSQDIIDYPGLTKEVIRTHKLIINTTPLGMAPDITSCPEIPYSYLTKDHFLYDLIYNPEETEFLRKGKARGAKVQNGMQMFYQQAELSYSIWETNLQAEIGQTEEA